MIYNIVVSWGYLYKESDNAHCTLKTLNFRHITNLK